MLAFLALALGLWAFVHQARLSGIPRDFDLSGFNWPARIEGVEVGSEDQARFQAEAFAPGSQLGIEHSPQASEPSTVTVILEPAYSRPYLLVTLISGLFFWTVAALVFAPRVDQRAVHLFFWISILYGTGVLVGGVYGHLWPLGFSIVRTLLQLTSLAFLPAAFLHLSLAFPTRATLLERWPRLPVILYLISSALVFWQATMFLGYYRAPGTESWTGLAAPQAVADGLMVLQVVAGFSVLVWRARRLDDARQRQQIRWLIFGFLVGSAPYVFLRTLPNLFGAPALIPAFGDRILELAVPTGFVFAVVRYRFLDIDIILRRGLIYGFLAAGMVVVVVLPVLLLGPGWTDPWPTWWRLVAILCGLLAGMLFRPLHELIGRGVDRAFFKIEREVEQTLRDLQADLDGATDHQDLGEILQRGIQNTLHLERCAVTVVDGSELLVAGGGDSPGIRRWWKEVTTAKAKLTGFLGLPEVVGETGVRLLPLPDLLAAEQYVAAQMLDAPDQNLGVVLLGPKRTGRLFISGDLEFLKRGTELAVRRLEKLSLARRIAGEKIRRRQMDELSKMKDDFLSRVAHDLRTPVTSLGWSIRNLDDGLAGELNEKQKDYLSSIRDSVDHLAGLVTDLLEISRLEKSKVEVGCVPMDPGRSVMRAVGTVKPLAEARDVVLETKIADSVTVLANDDKLTEVVVNLLANAVRYSPRQGKVMVTVVPADPHSARITVRDQGPGLGGLADPFGRFVQGKPGGDGIESGYGLGLTIAKEYVVLMGGEIQGGDHPDGGAVFTIDLVKTG